MFVITITDLYVGGIEVVGPWRTKVKAQEIKDRYGDPNSADYRDPTKYDVNVAKINRSRNS